MLAAPGEPTWWCGRATAVAAAGRVASSVIAAITSRRSVGEGPFMGGKLARRRGLERRPDDRHFDTGPTRSDLEDEFLRFVARYDLPQPR